MMALVLGVLPPGHGVHRVQNYTDRVRDAQPQHRRGGPEGGLQPWRSRLRSPWSQAQGRRRRAPDHADEGIKQRAPGHDMHRRHAGSGAGEPC